MYGKTALALGELLLLYLYKNVSTFDILRWCLNNYKNLEEVVMRVVDNQKIVSLEYVMSLDDGKIIDSTQGEPFVFLFGAGEIFPKLEEGIKGMAEGEEKDIVLEPEDAFGEYDPEAVQTIPQQYFGDETPVVGMQYYAHFEEGNEIPFFVKEVKDGNVTIDFNHPFAGHKIRFHVKIAAVRDASPEELEHGHAHHN